MLLTFDEASKLIEKGGFLHISGNEDLLKRLPKGNWIGGSTEYFMTEDGGVVVNDKLFVCDIAYENCKIATYDQGNIANVAKDAYDNGFTILILPFDSDIHADYSKHAASYEGMFIKNIVGWISGKNLSVAEQIPMVIDGKSGVTYTDKAVALHIEVPADKVVNVGIVNIFSPDPNSPEICFPDNGFVVDKCNIGGEEVVLAKYLAENNINTKTPFIGEYSGADINVAIKEIKDDVVYLYAPVFNSTKYSFSQGIDDYEAEFNKHLQAFKNCNPVFSCNCILNFLYGELDGKRLETFFGNITFGEIAYQLVNQTLVYVEVL